MFTSQQELLDYIPEAVYHFDPDGYVRYANAAAARLSGYDRNEIIEKHRTILYLTKEDTIKAEYEFNMALNRGEFRSEGWRPRVGGEPFGASSSLHRFATMWASLPVSWSFSTSLPNASAVSWSCGKAKSATA